MIDYSVYKDFFEKQFSSLIGVDIPWVAAYRKKAFDYIDVNENAEDKEAWKYTDFSFLPENFSTSKTHNIFERCPIQNDCILQNFDAYKLVFVDGVFQQKFSTKKEELPKGVSLLPLSNAIKDTVHSEIIKQQISSDKKLQKSKLANINLGLFSEGSFIHIKKNTLVEKPIFLTQITTNSCPVNNLQTLNIIQIDDNAHAMLIENYQGKANLLHNHVNIIKTEKNAGLHFYKIQREGFETNHIHTSFLDMEENSSFHSFIVETGGKYIRNEVHADLNGSRICCDLRGMILGKKEQIFDGFFPIEHKAPLSCSSQLFKSILSDDAKNIFYGKIFIPRGAYGSSAHQLNKNILLSNRAKAFTRPELEIYENDINCSHGATVGQLDDKALHYLMTRGIDKKAATNLLIEGFLFDMIEPIQNKTLKELVSKALKNWLYDSSL